MALEQDRQVFAVPGSPLSGKTRGSNRLLKEGAKLVECVEDVIEELAPQMAGRPAATRTVAREEVETLPISPASNTKSETPSIVETVQTVKTVEEVIDSATAILNGLKDSERLHVDSIIESSGLNAQTVLRLLLELELEGRVTQHPGKLFSLA
jgi:DNA processing protein